MRTLIVAVAAASCLATMAWADSNEPSAQIDGLVKRLESGKLEGAFVELFAGGLMADQKPMVVRAMDGQAKSAFEFYGRPTTYEIIETKKMGNSLIRMKWITKHKDDVPLFWNALFYRRNDKWEVLSIVFYDDPDKAGF